MVNFHPLKAYFNTEGTPFYDSGKGLTKLQATRRKTLKRLSHDFDANTALDIVSPGPHWEASGDDLDIETALDLLNNIRIYRNGQLLMSGSEEDLDCDVYFLEPNRIGFKFSIRPCEILQIWKNFN